MIIVESGGNPQAVSPAGAVGLMQLMPIAVAQVQIDNNIPRHTPNLFDPEVNMFYGKEYLEYCVGITNNITEALVTYNGGFTQVKRLRAGKKLNNETRTYPGKVWLQYLLLGGVDGSI